MSTPSPLGLSTPTPNRQEGDGLGAVPSPEVETSEYEVPDLYCPDCERPVRYIDVIQASPTSVLCPDCETELIEVLPAMLSENKTEYYCKNPHRWENDDYPGLCIVCAQQPPETPPETPQTEEWKPKPIAEIPRDLWTSLWGGLDGDKLEIRYWADDDERGLHLQLLKEQERQIEDYGVSDDLIEWMRDNDKFTLDVGYANDQTYDVEVFVITDEIVSQYLADGLGESPEVETSEYENPIMYCPQCGKDYVDFDGFGVLFCEACGFCQHASRSDGKCDYCGEPELEPVTIPPNQRTAEWVADLCRNQYTQGVQSCKSSTLAYARGKYGEDSDIYNDLKFHLASHIHGLGGAE